MQGVLSRHRAGWTPPNLTHSMPPHLAVTTLRTAQVESAVHGVVSRHGRLDGVASLVGNVVSGSATTTSLEEFRKVGLG